MISKYTKNGSEKREMEIAFFLTFLKLFFSLFEFKIRKEGAAKSKSKATRSAVII